MKFPKLIFFLLILPLTLLLDLILYAMMNACPSCSSFWQWVETEGAFSFPIVIGFSAWVSHVFPKSQQ